MRKLTLTLDVSIPEGTNESAIEAFEDSREIREVRADNGYIYVLTENGALVCIPVDGHAAPSLKPEQLNVNICAGSTVELS